MQEEESEESFCEDVMHIDEFFGDFYISGNGRFDDEESEEVDSDSCVEGGSDS